MEAPALSTSPTKYARVEVFSAQLIRTRPGIFEPYIFGVLLLRSCNCYCLLFESNLLEPQLIDFSKMKADVTLTGPERSIPVEDKILICPWFIDVRLSGMNMEEEILWRAGSDKINGYICKTIKVFFNTDLEMHFAVYNDAVEAHLDVFLVDTEWGDADEHILIRGTVSCTNSFVSDSGAESILFQKGSGDEVCLKPGKPLPLSRRMVVVPRGSNLHVDVRLDIGSEPEEASSVKDTVVFNGSSKLEEDCITIANRGKVSVKVTWMECKDHV